MLRCVAVLLCVATSQGLRVNDANRAPSNDFKVHMSEQSEESVLATVAKEGIAYPFVSELMTFDNDESADPDETIKIGDPNEKVDPKDDDMEKEMKSLKVEKIVLKEGDGKTFVEKGDLVKVRMSGTMKVKHFHDQQFESIAEYEYPMPKLAGAGGQKSPMTLMKDTDILPGMSLGGHIQVVAKNTQTGEVKNTMEMELLEVQKAGLLAAQQSESPVLAKIQATESTSTKILAKQKAQGMTMRRKVMKDGDGKTFVEKGDIITMRQIGTVKEKGKKLFTNTTTTYEYPMLAEPYTMKVKGFKFKVKFAWDEKIAPDMSEGEAQEISFDPIQVQLGFAKGPKFKFPSFTMELVKVQKANKAF